MVAAAAISAIAVTKWHPFAPKDYEGCAERAARDAKSKDALSILISVCRSDFKGRRKAGGGYGYYDECQGRSFDIMGPNPTPDEMKFIKDECSAYLDLKSRIEAEEAEAQRKAQKEAQQARAARAAALQAEQEARVRAQQESQQARAAAEQATTAALQARKLAAVSAVQVTSRGFDDCSYGTCHYLKVEVMNGSKEALSSVSIGLSSAPTVGAACPSSYATRETLRVGFSPGEKRATTIEYVDIEFSKHPLCIKVIDVEFAGR